MKKGVYGIAGVYPASNKNGVIDSEKEIQEILSGIPEGEKLLQLFALKSEIPAPVLSRIEVTDITALTADQLDALRNGDLVIKITGNQKHTYWVSYKDEVKGELSLVYADHQNAEEVYYEKVEGAWTYIQTDITTINQ